MSKTLVKLLFRQFTGSFILTFLIAMFVLMMQFLWKYMEDIAGKGLEWYIVSELLFYASAHLVPMALPLAILISSMMTFGSFAENNELLAYKSAGVSLLKLLYPLLILSFFLSVGSFRFMNNILPQANLKFAALLYDIKSKKPTLDIREGVFYNGIEGYSIRIGQKVGGGNKLLDILVYDHSDGPDNHIVIKAERGDMEVDEEKKMLFLTLYNGIRYEEIRDARTSESTLPHSRLKFSEYFIRFDLSSFKLDRTDIDLFKGNYKMLRLDELTANEDSVLLRIEEALPIVVEYIKPYVFFLRDSIAHCDSIPKFILKENVIADNFSDKNKDFIIRRAASTTATIMHLSTTPYHEMTWFNQSLANYRLEFHRKIILSFVVILLFLIGAPLGAIIRKGGLGLPSVVSILMFISFHIISISGEKLVKQLVLEAWAGMWLPVSILLPLAMFLTYKANKDSRIFSVEGYRFFKTRKERRFQKRKHKAR